MLTERQKDVKKYIAILGFGVVGGGCADVLAQNKKLISERCGFEIEVKYILDLRDFPDSPYADKVVHDYNIILNDPEVELVAEMMGGSHPALEFSLSAMKAKKSVVTSNKEVVATHGLELLACAKENGVTYMFEASVGGGIPVIHTIDTSLVQNDIKEIDGILNGTTNYILTRMNTSGAAFDEALAEAREKGYAEANPAADVDGIDACRKIAILAALAFGRLIAPESIHTEGIRSIDSVDVANASDAGYAVKLIGRTFAENDKICAYVCPMLVGASDPLSTVNDVFNGIKINGDAVGEVMLYGRGAGKMPTASAVVSDIINILTGNGVSYSWRRAEEGEITDFSDVVSRQYIRVSGESGLLASYKKAGDGAYITDAMSEADACKLEKALADEGCEIKARIRVLA
ncbi:MAG: homoserine dehydrogenase [Clostridia bacterium]|nr:homoserine dehydrogenase [Clostridia bacterium]